MLMTVYFSSSTASYQSQFDKLWAYYKNWENGNGLMNWEINCFSSVVGSNGATDAEEDGEFSSGTDVRHRRLRLCERSVRGFSDVRAHLQFQLSDKAQFLLLDSFEQSQ